MIHWAIQPLGLAAAEPVSLADAKNFCRVDPGNTADDAEILRFITAARQYAENTTARAIVATQFLMTLDRFPFPSNYDRALYSQDQYLPIGPSNAPFYEQFAIRLQRSPVVSIDAVKYVDQDGILQTLDPSQYVADLVSLQCRLLPAFGTSWPIAQYQANAVQVTFTAGSLFSVALDAGADTVTALGTGVSIAAGQGLKFYATGDPAAALSSPLAVGTVYYAVNVTGGGTACQLARTPGGSAIDLLTDAVGVVLADGAEGRGAGMPEAIRNAMLLHIALQYEGRDPGAIEVQQALGSINALSAQETIWGSDV